MDRVEQHGKPLTFQQRRRKTAKIIECHNMWSQIYTISRGPCLHVFPGPKRCPDRSVELRRRRLPSSLLAQPIWSQIYTILKSYSNLIQHHSILLKPYSTHLVTNLYHFEILLKSYSISINLTQILLKSYSTRLVTNLYHFEILLKSYSNLTQILLRSYSNLTQNL